MSGIMDATKNASLSAEGLLCPETTTDHTNGRNTMNFTTWLNTFIDEKKASTEKT